MTAFPARRGRRRDRRGRGLRGPLALPGPLTPDGVSSRPGPAQAFDDLVRLGVERLRAHLPGELDAVEFGVEEAPILPDDWTGDVPLSTHVSAGRGRVARVVVYRLPLAHRAGEPLELAVLLMDVLVDEVAALLGQSPDSIDPR